MDKSMNIVVLYDSLYGNTKKIAEACANAFASSYTVKTVPVSEAAAIQWQGVDLLIVGSPVQGGRPTAALQEWLKKIPPQALKDVQAAAFDTRFLEKDQKLALRLLMKTIGYAAPRIADGLRAKGARVTAPVEGFIVDDKKGPLRDGELERAASWAKGLVQ